MEEKEGNQLKDASIKKREQIQYLIREIQHKRIDQALKDKNLQQKINQLKEKFENEIF